MRIPVQKRELHVNGQGDRKKIFQERRRLSRTVKAAKPDMVMQHPVIRLGGFHYIKTIAK